MRQPLFCNQYPFSLLAEVKICDNTIEKELEDYYEKEVMYSSTNFL